MTIDRPTIRIISSDRYTTLRQLTAWDQDRVRRASILVAGAGALGNEVLKNLALLGVGHIVLVDFDRIELPNLSRSILFRASNEGQSKAQVAADALRAINPDVAVTVIQGDVEWEVGLGVFRRMDAIIGGLDNRRARVALNGHCWRVGKPWVDGALAETTGAVRIFAPPHGSCYECTLSDADYLEMSLRFSCQGLAIQGALEGKIATTPTVASVIGAMQVQEALKLLHGQPVLAGHEIIYDNRAHTLQIVELRRRAECLGHSTMGQVEEVHEFQAARTTARELLTRAQADLGPTARIELGYEVVLSLRCSRCHATTPLFAPQFRLRAADVACRACHEECDLQTTHAIDEQSSLLEATLASWGAPPAHVIRARVGRQSRYYELTGDIGGILPWMENA